MNGIRAERARSGWIKGVSFYDDPATTNTVDGVTFNALDLKNYSNVTDLRLLHIEEFKADEFPVTGISTNATNGLIQVSLQQPYCQTRHDYGSRYFAATNRWMFVQAFEELDEPGEWYLNRVTHKVYYYPYSFEDMTTAQVYAPVLQTLVSFTGTSTTSKVQNIRFENVAFEHGNWLFPRDYYIGGAQAEILYSGVATNARVGYSYEVPGQIILNNTAGIQFVGNTIRHLGSCGIHLYNGTLNTLIQGNVFYDLTGAAVLGGRWGGDAGIPNQQICTNTIVADNVIRNIGADFMAATLIDNLQHNSFQVLHNDMADGQYGGFHERTSATTLAAGAGQGGTVVSFNRISLANTGQRYGVGDIGYLYSNGVWPGSTIQGNDINGLNSLTGECNGMYFDNNSYGLTAISNVIHNVKAGQYGYCLVRFLTNTLNVAIENYGDATTNNFDAVTNINFHTFTGPLPVIAQGIVANAGLEPAYTNLLKSIYVGTNLAQGKFAWASSQASTNQSPGSAVDWDYTTLWQPAANDTNNCWWAVDLGAAYVIQRIEIAAQTDLNLPDVRCNFQVQGANDSGFTNATVLSEQISVPFAYKDEVTYKGTRLTSSWIKYVNNPQGFRYLRVIKTASGTLNFSEFQAFGYIVTSNLTSYTLTYTAGANGSISGTSPQTVNYGGSGTSVAAVAGTNYYFTNWSDGSTANPRTDANVTNNLAVTANFASLAAPMVMNSSMAANGQAFTLAGRGVANQAYVLLAATNLSPAAWLPVLTNSADTNGIFSFTDLQVTNYDRRFYRVQAQ